MKSPMRLGDIEYLKLVDKLMGHKHIQLTEAECAKEVAQIEDGAVSSFDPEQAETIKILQDAGLIYPKKRGWPKGKPRGPRKVK